MITNEQIENEIEMMKNEVNSPRSYPIKPELTQEEIDRNAMIAWALLSPILMIFWPVAVVWGCLYYIIIPAFQKIVRKNK